jgi:hypothetical protein
MRTLNSKQFCFFVIAVKYSKVDEENHAESHDLGSFSNTSADTHENTN